MPHHHHHYTHHHRSRRVSATHRHRGNQTDHDRSPGEHDHPRRPTHAERKSARMSRGVGADPDEELQEYNSYEELHDGPKRKDSYTSSSEDFPEDPEKRKEEEEKQEYPPQKEKPKDCPEKNVVRDFGPLVSVQIAATPRGDPRNQICPNCGIGRLTKKITTAGYMAAILLFPLGALACLSKQCCVIRSCTYCGNTRAK